MSRNLLIAALALGSANASAQVVNTQVNGLTFTNGLSSITDSSGLGLNANLNTGIGYLTDNNVFSYANNIGVSLPPTSSLQGNFNGPISSSATGIYILSMADNYRNNGFETPFGPSVSIQLLLPSGLSTARTYGESDFNNLPQTTSTVVLYLTSGGTLLTFEDAALIMSYMHISFSDFSVSPDQVLGIKLSNFTAQWPDISFIGAGYAGSPIPEPSTYGLILGGLALAGAAIRRRKSAK